jgi:hypothetical protein
MHRIDTGAHPPVRKRAYRHSPADRVEISRQTQEMLRSGIIEETDSPWSSPVLLVSKKDGTKRFCVDYRAVNSSMALTLWPLPTLEEVLDSISEVGPKFFTNCDLKAGYWQVALDPEAADRSGFQTHKASYICKRLPFGLCNAVQMFSALMQRVMKGRPASTVLVYLDDTLIMGKDPSDLLKKMDEIYARFCAANLRIHPAKCHWAVNRVYFLATFSMNGKSQ